MATGSAQYCEVPNGCRVKPKNVRDILDCLVLSRRYELLSVSTTIAISCGFYAQKFEGYDPPNRAYWSRDNFACDWVHDYSARANYYFVAKRMTIATISTNRLQSQNLGPETVGNCCPKTVEMRDASDCRSF